MIQMLLHYPNGSALPIEDLSTPQGVANHLDLDKFSIRELQRLQGQVQRALERKVFGDPSKSVSVTLDESGF